MSRQFEHYVRLFLGFVVWGLFLTGCANFASFQSADTVPKGETKTGGGLTYTKYETEIAQNDNNGTITVPAFAAWGRRGLTEDFEVHASAWLPLGAKAGAKYQLLGKDSREGFSLSVGGDLGYLSFGGSSSSDGDDSETQNDDTSNDASVSFIDFYLPVYTGYRFNKSLAAYLTPKYVPRAIVGTSNGNSEGAFFHRAGGTLGVQLGEQLEVMVEGSYVYNITTGTTAFTTGVGMNF